MLRAHHFLERHNLGFHLVGVGFELGFLFGREAQFTGMGHHRLRKHQLMARQGGEIDGVGCA